MSVIGMVPRDRSIGSPMMLVLTYCDGGSLLARLRAGKLNSADQRTTALHQIALGMAHLAEHGVVHRDLAARNILIDEDGGMRVADFGMSRKAATCAAGPGVEQSLNKTAVNHKDDGGEGFEVYPVYSMGLDGNQALPLRWTAPDALQEGRFSSQSDVWSFGIVAAEIFEGGQRPYHGLTNVEVEMRVLFGYRMPRGEQCPEEIYSIMLACWHEDPRARPRFTQLADAFGGMVCGQHPQLDFPATMTGEYLAPTPLAVQYANRTTSDVQARPAAGEVAEFFSTLDSADAPGFPATVHAAAIPWGTGTESENEAVGAAMTFATNKLALEASVCHGLTIDEIAAIHLYTQITPFYVEMNLALREAAANNAVTGLRSYADYLRLLLRGLQKLPPVSSDVLYRGVKLPMSVCLGRGVGVGDVVQWWAVTSTTCTSDVLQEYAFLGRAPTLPRRAPSLASFKKLFGFSSPESAASKERTVFVISPQRAVSIADFSAVQDDEDIPVDEAVFVPGTKFRITEIIDLSDRYPGLTQVSMSELPPDCGSSAVPVKPTSTISQSTNPFEAATQPTYALDYDAAESAV